MKGETLTAKDIMSRRVVSARPDEPLSRVARRLSRRRISAVPIVGRLGDLIGVVSQADLLRAQLGGEGGDTAQDVMTPWVVSCEESASLEEVGRLMTRKRIHRVIITREGKLAGVVSALDLVRAWLRRRGRRGHAGPEGGERPARDLLTVLRDDHARLLALAERAARWAGSPKARRRGVDGKAVVVRLLSLLAQHEERERLLLFPAIVAHAPGAEGLLESMAMEHGVIERAARGLRSAADGAADRAFRRRVLDFAAMLKSHVEDEERNVFAAARSLPPETLLRLGAELRERRRERRRLAV